MTPARTGSAPGVATVVITSWDDPRAYGECHARAKEAAKIQG